MNREKMRIIVAPFARTTQTIFSVKPNASILMEILLAIVSKIRGAGKSAITNVIPICQVAGKMAVDIVNDNSHLLNSVLMIWKQYFQKVSRIRIHLNFESIIPSVKGKLPEGVATNLKKYIDRSPLYNPYEEDNPNLILALYKNQRKSNDGKARGQRAVQARSGKYNIAMDAKEIKVTDFDNTIPEWDLTIQELQLLYDRSRFKRHFVWFANSPLEVNAKYKLVGTTLVQSCSKTSFKRRIPWLYPKTGIQLHLETGTHHCR